MEVYHFSDNIYQIGNIIPIGNFKKIINDSSEVVKHFEKLMEEQRICILGTDSISRLDCLFTFPKNVAEGFRTKRKYLYELELRDNVKRESRNHEIGTYFSKLFQHNSTQLIDNEIELIKSYWTTQESVVSLSGVIITFEEEILVKEPLTVKRVI